MPATLGRLFIDPGGISTVINITGPAGGLLTTYTAVNGASATSFPDTITTITEYNFTEVIPATISAKVNGVETANSAGGTLTVNIGQTTGQQVAVGLSGSEVATAIAGLSTLASSTTLGEGVNIVVGTTTGSKIGTATTQKLGFYNVTPVVQPAGTTDIAASLVTLGLRAASSNPPLNLGTGAITAGAASVAALTATSVAATGTVALTDTMTVTDAKNIVLGSSTGNIIGTAITQKLGFYNATPIAQRAGAAQAAVVTTATTQTTPYGFATQAQGDAIVTLVNELRAWAVAQGFIKGAA